MNSVLSYFTDKCARRGIVPDTFQTDSMRALEEGRDVLLSAPTGAGKTLVAQFGIELALAHGCEYVYTAPVKALSNQKYKQFCLLYGEENVGLLTGDTVINSSAPILVMTTEVLRNILFSPSGRTRNFGYVVLDEIHYLSDPWRGPVWEEIILQLPAATRLISLSATIENIGEFASWLISVRGDTAVVTSDLRPVPLTRLVAHKNSFVAVDDFLAHREKYRLHAAEKYGRHFAGRGGSRGVGAAARKKLVFALRRAGYLPAIYFIFSRRGCDRAVQDFIDADICFTDSVQRREIRLQLDALAQTLGEQEMKTVRFRFWSRALLRGFGAHHAGMFPALKELTEKLMSQGLLALVYATGTLALGIDMPVRTVVLESLMKWDGSGFVNLSATEFTQLIGRAGRRGKDVRGYAVTVNTPELDPQVLEYVSAGKAERLESAFYPAYNTVVNLLQNYGLDTAKSIMGRSFAQAQINEQLAGEKRKLARICARIGQLKPKLEHICAKGDFLAYLDARAQAGRASKSARKKAREDYRRAVEKSWRTVKTGGLYAFSLEGELVYALVLSVRGERIRMLNSQGERIWVHRRRLTSVLRALGTVSLPHGLSLKNAAVREDLAARISAPVKERIELGTDMDLTHSWDRMAVSPTERMRENKVHFCPDLPQHLAAAEEYLSLLERRQSAECFLDEYRDAVIKEFLASCRVLECLGYLQRSSDTYKVSMNGNLLRGIHNESDLLITLCLNEPEFKNLDPLRFAALCAGFLGDKRLGKTAIADKRLRRAWAAVEKNYVYLSDLESKFAIVRTFEPDSCGISLFYMWGRGEQLSALLHRNRTDVGDFISAARRLIDLLRQLSAAGEGSWVGHTAQEAIKILRRWDWL